ncbi:hypothetical protein KCU98_g7257, partial [Aureobasidium melanogenum]
MSEDFKNTSEWLRVQWRNPRDIFTILLIIGGDIVRVAVAQISYAVSAMLSAMGDTRLMPNPELDCLLINAKTGYARANKSWILSRMLRDFDYWYPRLVDSEESAKTIVLQRASTGKQRIRIGLRVSVWQCTKAVDRGHGDVVYWIGLLVAILQLALAAIPWGLYGEWLTFMVTAVGTILAFVSGALPQWTEEKYGVRNLTERKDVVLTQGNGAHDALLILGPGNGLDLEAMAAPYRQVKCLAATRISSILLATLWIALLICVAGWQQHTWYLLGIGILGLIHNVFVAGKKRQPSAFGIHLIYRETIVEEKVMHTLWRLEEGYPGAGKALLDTFFPGKLRKREDSLWAFAEKRCQACTGKSSAEREKWGPVPPFRSPNGMTDYIDDIPIEGAYGEVTDDCAGESNGKKTCSDDPAALG